MCIEEQRCASICTNGFWEVIGERFAMRYTRQNYSMSHKILLQRKIHIFTVNKYTYTGIVFSSKTSLDSNLKSLK